MRLQTNLAFGVIAFGLATAPGLAQTQSLGRGNGHDTAYEPRGIRVGGFMLYPELELSGGFDDNVFAQPVGEIDDLFSEISPSLILISNWTRHALTLSTSGSIVTYNEQSSEDRSDWSVGAEARIDVHSSTALYGLLSYSSITETRGNTNALGAAAGPTSYTRFDAYAELRHQFNRIGFTAGAGLTSFDYDDVPMTGGGTIDNDNRDRDVILAQVEVNYEVSPGMRAFVRGAWNRREYDLQPPVAAVSRDSEGYAVVGGLQFDLTNLITGEVYAGYLEQDYDALRDAGGFSYGASLNWDVTQLTTISLSADRSVGETNSPGASGYLSSNVMVDVEHELMRNVIIGGNLSFTNNDYVGIVREEDIWVGSLRAEVKLNRNASAEIGYAYESRTSSLPGADYERNTVRIGLRFVF